MNKSLKISGLVWALLLASGVAGAAGLGKLTVHSTLGQPLRAEIELLSVNKDELADITAKLASPDAFKQARIDRVEAMGALRFTVDQRASGQPVIRITSTSGISDPFLDLLIELNWSSGRLIREYTILLDPPADAKPAEPAKVATVAPEAPRNGQAKPAPVPAPVQEEQKPKPAPAPVPAQPKRYGPVKSGETLRGIAGKLKPSEASLEQMMVATALLNADMPLIRYETGDRATLATEPCACGRGLPVLAAIEGRVDDMIVTPDGRHIGRLDPVFKADLPIHEAQIIQTTPDTLRVLYVPTAAYTPGDGEALIGRIHDRVGPAMRVVLEAVPAIPRTANGKFRAVISEVNR